MLDSTGIIINGQRLKNSEIGEDPDKDKLVRSGKGRIHLLGWGQEAQVTITQNGSLPLQLLNIGVEVSA